MSVFMAECIRLDTAVKKKPRTVSRTVTVIQGSLPTGATTPRDGLRMTSFTVARLVPHRQTGQPTHSRPTSISNSGCIGTGMIY
jgi:hypothetical protein